MTASLPTSHPARYSLALLLVVAFALNLLYGMSPVFAAGAPIAFLSVPNEGFIGEEFTFTVSFDNTHPADTGYGPYIDLVLPAAGVDGAGTATDDGITFRGASYLGTPVTPVAPPFICTGSFTHPLTRLNVSCTPGSQIIVLQPPYGSFTAIQPPAEIVITAELSDHADLNVPLSMEARAGFFLGSDPLDNPLSDPPILQPGSGVATYTPIFWTLTKTYIGPEDETATGPNFPHQYRIDIDIADGQTIAPLALSDLLPPTMQYVAVVDTRIHNVSVGTTPGATPATTVPGGTLTREFVSVTGTPSAADATLLFSFFVPRLDASSEAVLPAASGDDFVATNDALAIGTWVPTDHRDLPLTGMLNDLTTIDHELEEQSIAIQKHVANPALPHSPNDILTYTLDIQVSDYFAFEDLIVVDHLSDGLRFDDDATPILACTEHGTASSGSFAITNYTVSDNWTDQNGLVPPDPGLPAPPHTLDPAANDGTTTLTFKLSDQLISLGADAQLLGGGVPSGGLGTDPLPNNPPLLSGPTNCQISYQAIIQDQYTDTFLSGDQSVDQGHILEHNALIDGAALDVSNLVPTGLREDDDTTAGVQIGRGDLFKSIYAVNGDLLCPPGNCSGTALPPGTLIKPGDSVTYRLSLTLPSSDVDGLQLIDYLPLPIFDVNDNVAPIISAITSFDPTVSAATPPVGTAKFGPSDDFTAESGIIPDLSVDPLTNSVIFDYGDYDDPTNDANTIDLLLTVTASFDPFADKLLLTNQVRELEEPTNAGAQMLDKIVQLRIGSEQP
jgi:large repetitive protein